jgi:hypothetical protein
MEMEERQGRRRKQLLDYLRKGEGIGYLREKTSSHSRVYRPVVRHTTYA